MKGKTLTGLFGLFALLILSGASCGGGVSDGGVYVSFDLGENWEQRVFVRQEGDDNIYIDKVNVDSIVIDPTNDNTLYMTSRENGVFKTTNNGENWFQTGLREGRVRSLSIDPEEPDTLYITYGISVLKSEDGGSEWTEILKDASGAQMTNVLVDVFDPEIIWATTGTGTIYKTTDAGKNWQVNYRFPNGVRWLVSSEDDTRQIYAAVAEGGLYTTTNKGRSWEQSEALLEIRGTGEVYHLEVDPEDKDNVYVFTGHGLIKSTDGGDSWETIETLLGVDAAENVAVQSFVVNHPNQILFSVNNTLHKSTDGGTTWRTITTFPSTLSIQDITMDPEKASTIYAGVREVEEEGGMSLFPRP